jgi:hypothetical protein
MIKILYVMLLLSTAPQWLRAQSIMSTETAKLQSLIGTWDVYVTDGKSKVGEFSVTALGKSPAIQTRFILPAMQSEVYGTWVYDAEIKAVEVFEITHTGQVRSYTANFTKPEVLWFKGFSKDGADELTEESSLTWLPDGKIEIWSKDFKAGMEVKMIMIKRK